MSNDLPTDENATEDDLLALTGDLDPDDAPGDWSGADAGTPPDTDDTIESE